VKGSQSGKCFAWRQVCQDSVVDVAGNTKTSEAGADLGRSPEQPGRGFDFGELQAPEMLTTLLEERVDGFRVWIREKTGLPVELGRLRHLVERFADLKQVKKPSQIS